MMWTDIPSDEHIARKRRNASNGRAWPITQSNSDALEKQVRDWQALYDQILQRVDREG
jgi:hypothetical protein